MHHVFVCALVPSPDRPNVRGPAFIYSLSDSIPANTYALSSDTAVGLADLTAEQAAAFDAEPDTWVFDWSAASFDVGLIDWLAERGIEAGVEPTDTPAQVFAKVASAVGHNPQALVERYRALAGAPM